MTDIYDRAEELEQRHRSQALANARNRTEPKQLIIDHTVVCLDCREPIPELRLLARPRAARCIDCQQHYEKERHRYG